mmetsp:Transcript_39488/g.106824  ORF Transcript_39488/g.106824 Transcript_39488/m.106824 type:complete len:231 (-) Transcript_39488:121-813(-)
MPEDVCLRTPVVVLVDIAELQVAENAPLEELDHPACRDRVVGDEGAAALVGVLKRAGARVGHAGRAEGGQVAERGVAREEGKLPAVLPGDSPRVVAEALRTGQQVVHSKPRPRKGDFVHGVEEVLELGAGRLGNVAESDLQLREDQWPHEADRSLHAPARAGVGEVGAVLPDEPVLVPLPLPLPYVEVPQTAGRPLGGKLLGLLGQRIDRWSVDQPIVAEHRGAWRRQKQ